jgi:hypothetical protein
VCVCVRVCIYVCMFVYRSRTDVQTCTELGTLIHWDHKENIERSKLRKTVLSSSLGEGGSCRSETEHDRRTAPRPKLFVSARRLQELRSQTRKLSWVRVSVKMLGFGIIFSVIFNDTYRSEAFDKVSGNNIDKKCKNLPNFSAATLRTLC